MLGSQLGSCHYPLLHLAQKYTVTATSQVMSSYENTGPWDPTGNMPYYTQCNVNQADVQKAQIVRLQL